MSNLMKIERMEENANKKTFSNRTTTTRTREAKVQLHGKMQEQKMHCVSAPGPQLQLGRPPTAGRKIAAVLIHPNQFLLWFLSQIQLVQIIGDLTIKENAATIGD